MYVITPHGGNFANPIEVRIPAPAVTLESNQEFKLAKAQPGGEWVVMADTELDGGMLSIDVDSFSYFMSVVVTYLLPIAQSVPFSAGASLTCLERNCVQSMGPVTATYTVTTNNGQMPTNCANPSLRLFAADMISYSTEQPAFRADSIYGGLADSRLTPNHLRPVRIRRGKVLQQWDHLPLHHTPRNLSDGCRRPLIPTSQS